jgi:hypothetical protein
MAQEIWLICDLRILGFGVLANCSWMKESFFMQTSVQKIEEIKRLAVGRFDKELVDDFIAKFHSLLDGAKLISAFAQISTDEGEELEVGFFTSSNITDITLSKGKIYFYSYPINLVNYMAITDNGEKWILSIYGEKKFDYNVVKPGSIDGLKKYEAELQAFLASVR